MSRAASPEPEEAEKKKKKRTAEGGSKLAKQIKTGKKDKSSPAITLKLPGAQGGVSKGGTLFNIKKKASKKKKSVKPDVELAKIFEEVMTKMMENPQVYAFCKPVNPQVITGYYEVVKNPKTLEEILKDVKDKKYDSVDDLKSDLNLVVSNCILFNGEEHPLTRIIMGSVAETKNALKAVRLSYLSFNYLMN